MEGTIKQAFDLVEAIRTQWPGTPVVVDFADPPEGTSWVDLPTKKMTIEIKAELGYGLHYKPSAGFTGPDQVYNDAPALLARLGELL